MATTCIENGRSKILKLVRFKETERIYGTQKDRWIAITGSRSMEKMNCFLAYVMVFSRLQGVEYKIIENDKEGWMWREEAVVYFQVVSQYLVRQREKRSKLGQHRQHSKSRIEPEYVAEVLTIQELPSIGKRGKE
jgi:uncharacterized membrane protein